MTEERKPLRSYGRIKARTLKPRQERLLADLLPHLSIPQGPINLDALFKRPSPLAGHLAGKGREGGANANRADVGANTPTSISSPQGGGEALHPPINILEIGFGGGEHLVAQALANPDWVFLGAEPFLNGIASCLRHIEAQRVTNVRLHHGDARDILTRLPNASLHRIDILFPDPWPKTRHHKRRLINPEFIAACARVLQPGGELRFATDWRNYAAWTLELFLKSPAFAWLAEGADDWRIPWPGHTPTRYELKKLGDCSPIYLRFSRAFLS